MRVIGGKYKGRVLKGPKHQGVRPTAERVREALFNILGTKIVGADFLDLFAGSGAMGIEALSRGANSVVFVDLNPLSIRLIKSNLYFMETKEKINIIHSTAAKSLALFAQKQTGFDIVFVDPPFEAGLHNQTLMLIEKHQILKPDGILVCEHPKNLSPVTNLPSWTQTRTYGDIQLSFFQKTEEYDEP